MSVEYATCDTCGYTGHISHPVYGIRIFASYDGYMLCSTCRVDARLADGDYT